MRVGLPHGASGVREPVLRMQKLWLFSRRTMGLATNSHPDYGLAERSR